MLVSLGWVLSTVLDCFMFLFDTTVYGLAIVCINVFNGIARMDFFSTEAGASIYSDIARRLYAILGIIMIFFFAYQLVLLIINPDGDTKASTGLVKTTITSIIMIAFFPTLFKYMSIFQEHVLTEGTVTAIVLGEDASGGDSDKSGRNTALIVYLSMYHPGDGGYSSVVNSSERDANGDLLPATVEHCKEDSGANDATCELWISAYENFVSGASFGGITAFTWNSKLTDTISEEGGSTYYAVIIIVCGAVLIWFYASYAIDLGYRTVKLGFLQIISPAPLIMRIFPKTAKTFEKWKHELIRTYLEVFVRVFIVAFVIAIIQKLPVVIIGLFQALKMSGWCIPFALVALVFGVLKFGKELPKLVKDIFDSGSGLFNGIDWKPGVGRRLEAGKDDVVGFGKKMANYGKKFADKTVGAAVRAPLRAKRGIARIGGAMKGMTAGAAGAIQSNKTKGFNTLRAAVKGGAAGAKGGFQAGGLYNPADKNAKLGDAINDAGKAGGLAGRTTELFNLGKYGRSFIDEFGLQTMDAKTAKIDELRGNIKDAGKEMYDRLGVTDKKTKADEFARAELDKARDDLKKGATVIRGRTMNKDGEYGGEVRTFASLTEMEEYYKKAKQDVYENQVKNQFNSDATRQQVNKVMSETTQKMQENLSAVLTSSMDDSMINSIVGKAGGKLAKEDLDIMKNSGLFGEGAAADTRYNELLKQINDNQKLSDEREVLKKERDMLNVQLDDLQRGRNKVSENLYAQFGQTISVNGSDVVIDQSYIDSQMADFDSKINAKIADIASKTAEIKTKSDAITNPDVSSKEIQDFIGTISQKFQNGEITSADEAARLTRLMNEMSGELNKEIQKQASHINIDFSGGDAGGSGGSGGSGGDADKK